MEVLLVGDKKQAENVVLNLRNVSPFDDLGWVFRICAEKDFDRQTIPPVLVVFRTGPGSVKFLKKVKKRIPPDTRTVFVTGPLNERARVFMDGALALGFLPNFVTGQLPGDYPYTLPMAIMRDKPMNRENVDGLRVFVDQLILDDRFNVVKISPRSAKSDDRIAVVLDSSEDPRPWLKAPRNLPIIVLGKHSTELIEKGVIYVDNMDDLFRVCNLFKNKKECV